MRRKTHMKYHPENNGIARKFNAQILEQKKQQKIALQEEIGWPEESRQIVLCLPAGIMEKTDGILFEKLLPGLLTLPVNIVIRGKGLQEYGTFCSTVAEEHSHKIAIIPNTQESLKKMYASADMALFSAKASTRTELRMCIRSGVIPIAPEENALKNYDPNQEKGFAFLYTEQNPWSCFAAIIRALETYRFPFDWRTIQRHAMEWEDRITR